MARKTEPMNIVLNVEYIDKSTLTPVQAANRKKAMRIYERIFRKAEERARHQPDCIEETASVAQDDS